MAYNLTTLYERDLTKIHEGARMYGPSWKQRGGAGAYMVAIRKWDRLKVQLSKHEGDWTTAIASDQRAEGIMDDIRDLRCYLLMILAETAVADGVDTDPLAYLTRIAEQQEVLLRYPLPLDEVQALIERVEIRVQEYQWDIFRMLRSSIPGSHVRPWLLMVVFALYTVDAHMGSTIGDVAKDEAAAEAACLVLLSNGDRLALPERFFGAMDTIHKAETLDGDAVILYPGTVIGELLVPMDRIAFVTE